MHDLLSLPQIAGYLAAGVSLAIALSKRDHVLRYGSAFAFVAWAWHFWLLGDSTTAALALLVALRQVISALVSEWSAHHRFAIAGAFALLFTAATALTWRGWWSLLPWVSAMNATFATMLLAGWRMRRQMLVTEVAVAANGIMAGSVMASVLPVIGVCLSVVTILRLRADERRASSALEGA